MGRCSHHFTGGGGPFPLGHPGHGRQRRVRSRRPPIPPIPPPRRSASCSRSTPQLPASTPNGPWTDARIGTRHNRINHVGELPDGSGRLYVPDLNGNLYFLEDREPSVYLDVKAQFPEFLAWRGLGSGFGFVTFHPEFAENGKFYTTHTENPTAPGEQTYPGQPLRSGGVQSVVTEWTADDPAADTFTGSRRELFRYRFAGQIHAIQQIDFNPTAEPGDDDYGLLYLAVGDGGYGVENDIPQALRPVRQDPSHRPGRHRRAERRVRHPRHEPVGRRAGSPRRDLGHRHARPAPLQLGR